ncbi:Wnt-binding factor required for Wnt secretion-domain-containing protein [Tribonema minus]|uniref:Wnt-binding factor required for Wnt secretion-domain-containing protein n=1 Tax=Tribonema minus TaxID=303371 RepID=A0A835YX26_9STRA|nr:Wnt-binding factor required for Wnt secretion-domain-containing protein [Tribonema minus]
MEHDGYSNVRIEGSAFSKPRLLCLGLTFFGAFILLLAIGAGGPDVWVVEGTNESATVTLVAGSTSNPFGKDRTIKQENQIFSVNSRISKPVFAGINTTDTHISATLGLELTVTADGKDVVDGETVYRDIHCYPDAPSENGTQWCSWFDTYTVDLIDATQYVITGWLIGPDYWTLYQLNDTALHTVQPASVRVETQVWYVNDAYTKFEMGWKYFFVVVTFVAALLPRWGYYMKLRTTRRSTWSFQQKWTLTLLIGLFWFNDPFFAARVYSEGGTQLGFTAFYMLCVLAFMSMLLLWWLCVFSDMVLIGAREGAGGGQGSALQLHGRCYWAPKAILVAGITLVNAGAYFYYRYTKTVSPEYDGVSDAKTQAKVFAGLLGTLMAVYLVWLAVAILRGCVYVQRLSAAYQFLYSITMVTFFISIVGVFTAAFYPWSTSGITFLGFHGLYNLYIWTLAFAYAPTGAERLNFGIGMSDRELMSVSAPMPAKPLSLGFNSNGAGRAFSPDRDFHV